MTEKEWLDNFNRGVPDKYPVLLCGWPDEAHGIDHAAYLAACQAALDIVEEGEDAPVFLKFREWKVREREKNEDRDTLGFSWHRCDICGALAGDRHAVTAYKDLKSFQNGDYLTLEVCGDCLFLIANGETPCHLDKE